MESDFSTVVLIIGFVRSRNLSRILDTCLSSSDLPVIVSLDGPRNERDVLLINESCQKVLSFNEPNRILLRQCPKNFGLSKHIVGAIDFAMSEYDSVIVLEDDCIPAVSFIDFCISGLKTFKNQNEIIYLSGTNLDVDFSLKAEENCLKTQYGQIWGWATWKDRWVARETRVNYYYVIFSRLPLLEKIFWIRNFRKPLWDSVWGFYNLLRQNGYSIMPKDNLVSNVGFDNQSTNYGEDSSRNLEYSLSKAKIDVLKCADYNSEFDRKLFDLRYRQLS